MSETSHTDFSVPQSGLSSSPKGQYTYFLLQQCARHQYIMATKDDNIYNIERSCLSLMSWCPDKKKRAELMKNYYDAKTKFKQLPYELDENGAIVSAAIDSVGCLVDYLNEALELTEESFAMLI